MSEDSAKLQQLSAQIFGTPAKIAIDRIDIGARIRQDLHDIPELARSIKEEGLLQPICLSPPKSEGERYKLVAGERRLRAHQELGLEEIEFVLKDPGTEARLRKWELIENLYREPMTWQEKTMGIADLHRQQELENWQDGWTLKQTGDMLNMTNANVLYAVRISDYLREGDEEVSNARGPAEALQIIAKRQEQIAQNLLAKTSADKATRTLSDGESWDDIEDKYEDVEEPGALDEDEDPDFVGDGDAAQLLRGLAEEAQASAEDKPKKVINLSKRIYLGDSLELLKGAPAESFGACITDPPYGIDMDNLDQENLGNKNVELIRATHEVGENLALLKAIIPHIYRVLQKDAFFVFWYDLDHHEKLQTWCKEAGFSTQRWPLVWSKTSPCKNGQAHINFTKNYEVAMVCRKGTPKLQKPETSSIWVGSLDTLERSSGHPFVKPYALWEWIINATCPKGVRILEPFAGHGSAVRACARLGYDFVAIETLDEVYNGLIGNMKSFYRMAYAEYDIKFD